MYNEPIAELDLVASIVVEGLTKSMHDCDKSSTAGRQQQA